MSVHTVGRFTYDPATGKISGPAEYMREQGFERIARWGDRSKPYDHTLAAAYEHSGDMILAMLVTLQTDYAGWHGSQVFFDRIDRGLVPETGLPL